MRGPLGPWPAPCPIGPGEAAALWLDGTRAGAVAGAWLTLGGVDWCALVPAALAAEQATAARAQAGARPTWRFAPAGPAELPGGWGPAQAAAAAASCLWLVVPQPRRAAADPLAPLRWHAAEEAMRLAGTRLWLPFALLDDDAVERLGVALGL